MLSGLLKFLAFLAVTITSIFSFGFKNPVQSPVLLKENIATSSVQSGKPQSSVKKEQAKNALLPIKKDPVLPAMPIVATGEFQYFVVKADSLQETNINIQSIALVRCSFHSQYYAVSSQPWGEESFNVGTGVIISSLPGQGGGIILTARHILEVSDNLLNDPAGRVWKRVKCDIALTDKDKTPIASVGSWGSATDKRFQDAEIIFTPGDEEYKATKGFDFALLRIKSADNLPRSELFPYLVEFGKQDPVILIGYPGRESVSPQQLERFDGEFSILTFYEQAVCASNAEPCGLRYIFRRYPLNFEKDFWKNTDFGIITPYFRGGFSGAPVFYKGNLIGITTHGASGSNTEDGWDQAVILTSWDILGFLKINNFNL